MFLDDFDVFKGEPQQTVSKKGAHVLEIARLLQRNTGMKRNILQFKTSKGV